MRKLCYVSIASIVFAWGVLPAFGQDFLKQLEEKLQRKQPNAPQVVQPSEPMPEGPESVETSPEDLPVPSLLEDPGTSRTNPAPLRLPENSTKKPPTDSATGRTPNRRPTPAPPKPPESPFGTGGEDTSELPMEGGGGYLGLTLEPLVGGGFGLAVVDIASQSPAWKAGFRMGDRIVGVAGQAVTTIDQFAAEIAKFPPGTPVKFLVQRLGRSTNLTAVLQDRTTAGRIQGMVPGTALPLAPPVANSGNEGTGFLGVTVSDLSEAFRRQFGIAAYRGASVTDVMAGSAAQMAGIRPGDCIIEIDGRVIQSATGVVDVMRSVVPGQNVIISYYRGRQLQSVEVPIAANGSTNAAAYNSMSNNGVDPAMLTPEYVIGLQEEVSRLQGELQDTQNRLRDLEARLQSIERKR